MFVVFWVVPCGACASDRVSGERSDHNIVGSEALRLQWSRPTAARSICAILDACSGAHTSARPILARPILARGRCQSPIARPTLARPTLATRLLALAFRCLL